MTFTVWIDVEDLFEYALVNTRPSGIQRLSFEVYQALNARDRDAGQVQFVRHAPAPDDFRIISWSDVASLFETLAYEATSVSTADGAAEPCQPKPGPDEASSEVTDALDGAPLAIVVEPRPTLFQTVLRGVLRNLPSSLRSRVIDVLLTSRLAATAWLKLLGELVRAPVVAIQQISRRSEPAPELNTDPLSDEPIVIEHHAEPGGITFANTVAAGDVLLVLGSPWSHTDYGELVERQRGARGVRFALLVYDLIPLRRPEWCHGHLVHAFRTWFDTVFPLCDHVFTISQATATDVEAYAIERGLVFAAPPKPLPIGTVTVQPAPYKAPSATEMPAAGSYALIVSTIEARKNHMLLFRVWRRLLEDLPREQVPTLVFAGRTGWLVADLMQQIANTSNLDGKLVLVDCPTDSQLESLYSGCLFTVFPSFYEGWGLPVSESLAFGKPCLISNRTSLPEAGGRFARAFDPDNLHDAYAVIRNTIEDREGLVAWAAEIRRDFKPVAWAETAEALLAELASAKTAPTEPRLEQEAFPSSEDFGDEAFRGMALRLGTK